MRDSAFMYIYGLIAHMKQTESDIVRRDIYVLKQSSSENEYERNKVEADNIKGLQLALEELASETV